ncbi:hypothetical protein FB45DRAFT_945841 [Roridomyces roridus]|uniref:Fibronectin type-III domain-containing protein n=1 Tax=Roridomyces roridus TaxID=1738132 RepID=A0AAD7B2F9_9AGAR|nr:hypothetical protein FB45DRAFT_945841 [Roridomyces roridus]
MPLAGSGCALLLLCLCWLRPLSVGARPVPILLRSPATRGLSLTWTIPGTSQPCNGRVLTTGNFESTTEVPNVQLADLDSTKILAAATVSPSKRSTVVTPGAIIEPVLIAAAVIAFIIAVPCIMMCHLQKRVLDSDKGVDVTSQASLPKPFEPEPEVEQYNVFHTSWQLHAGDLRSVDRTLTSSSSVTTTRQLYISNQVNRAREKVKELEELSSLLLRSASHTSNNQHNQQMRPQLVWLPLRPFKKIIPAFGHWRNDCSVRWGRLSS